MRIEDSCLGLIQFENGAQATIESDLTPRETASINCNFYGTEGVIQVDENAVRLMNASTNGWKELSSRVEATIRSATPSWPSRTASRLARRHASRTIAARRRTPTP